MPRNLLKVAANRALNIRREYGSARALYIIHSRAGADSDISRAGERNFYEECT